MCWTEKPSSPDFPFFREGFHGGHQAAPTTRKLFLCDTRTRWRCFTQANGTSPRYRLEVPPQSPVRASVSRVSHQHTLLLGNGKTFKNDTVHPQSGLLSHVQRLNFSPLDCFRQEAGIISCG
jgi:hypothetical protein